MKQINLKRKELRRYKDPKKRAEYMRNYMRNYMKTHRQPDKRNHRWLNSTLEFKSDKIKYQRLQRYRFKLELVKLRGGQCEKCGYNKNLAALGFHHKDKTDKEFQISRGIRSIDKVLPELEKCSLLCANCHMEQHHPKQDLI